MKNAIKRLALAASLAGALGAFGEVEPRVGCAMAFRGFYGSQTYISNRTFKGRPIVEEMAKAGIDLCLAGGPSKPSADRLPKYAETPTRWQEYLTQFNCVWLITEHEDQCPYDADETAAALKAYVEAGGGLVITHSAGRYSEAPVDAYWKKVFSVFDMEILHEEVTDPSTEDAIFRRGVFYADTFADHPVTKGVPGLWLPLRGQTRTWGSVAVKYGTEWRTVVSTTPAGKSVAKHPRTNLIEPDLPVTYKNGPVPIVAVRQLGKGRIVFIAIHKDNCGWAYNIDAWPNYTERAEFKGRKSDAVTLLENACRWASEPSLGQKGFAKHYVPYEAPVPPYQRNEQFGVRTLEKRVCRPAVPADRAPGAIGVVGLHSNYSDGESTVAEYAAEAKKIGVNCLVFTDPLDKLGSEENLDKLIADCRAVSDDTFYACPGVEYVDSSGFEWIVFHEKVAFPKAGKWTRDGREYETFDGKVVLQRHKYGLQNLYRGGILNSPRFKETGTFSVNNFYFNFSVVRAYEDGKLLYDNEALTLHQATDLQKLAVCGFTRCRSAKKLRLAAETSVTCCDSIAGFREAVNGEGQHTNEKADKHGMFVRFGGDLLVKGLAFDRISGTDVIQCPIRVTSSDGLSEVRLEDGSSRTLARLDAKGATEFADTLTFEFDRQSYPTLVVTDKAGHRAVTTPHCLQYYHAGMHRCGDNSNLLSYNPMTVCNFNWDDIAVPFHKPIVGPLEHYHLSESFFWDDFYAREKSRVPKTTVETPRYSLKMKGIDYPSEEKQVMPSCRTVFTLNQPNVVSIIDQYVGEKTFEPTRSVKNGTFGNCSMPVEVGPNPYWRRHRREFLFCDNIDCWWYFVYFHRAPDYRGGYSVVEGEVEILQDITLAEPIALSEFSSFHPVGVPEAVRKCDADGLLRAGSYYAPIVSDTAWYGWFPLEGSDALNVTERRAKDGRRMVSKLCLGKAGDVLKAGTKLKYRFATGSFVEDPHGTMMCDWMVSMLNGSGFNHVARKGEVTDVNGILDLKAEDGEAAVELGPTWFIQRYPVRVAGLVDNGSAYWEDGLGTVKPLAFSEGLAFAEVPLEQRKTWRFRNYFLADDPALRFSYVPAMKGHPRATVQVLNPTDREISAKVRNLLTGEDFAVTVPAGGKVVRALVVVEKLGTTAVGLTETNPVNFRGKTYVYESVRPATEGNALNRKPYGRLRDLKEITTFTPPCAEGLNLSCAYAAGDRLVVTGVKEWGGDTVWQTESSDLKTWTEPRAVVQGKGWRIFNTSVCKAGDRYVMVFERGKDGSPEIGTQFTMFFAESKDLKDWKVVDGASFGKEFYTGSPCLRHHDGWFYFFYLAVDGFLKAPDGRDIATKPLFRMRVVRSRDLKSWEKGNCVVLDFDDGDRKVYPGIDFSARQLQRIASAEDRNASDIDMCDTREGLLITYSWGDQQGREHSALARVGGVSEREFCESFFKGE